MKFNVPPIHHVKPESEREHKFKEFFTTKIISPCGLPAFSECLDPYGIVKNTEHIMNITVNCSVLVSIVQVLLVTGTS